MRSARTVARWRVAVAALAGAWAVFGGTVAPAAAGGLVPVLDTAHLTPLVQADSVLEIDRTANLQFGGGSAGSDNEGGGVPEADDPLRAAPAGRPASAAGGRG
ncbi:hypothetical protein [Kitasatospora sp. NPDC047058]|uniref:hypothetical protein n=1 Tax=Kitasatospora sp. NPDC047058 TaxID=3155620 RepID=UPI00340454DB